jgi:hypothetical protein
MAALTRHLLHQRRVIASLSSVALQELVRPFRKVRSKPEELPGRELLAELRSPSAALVHDYVQHVGGSPLRYADTIPPHFFAQWSMPLAALTLRKLPYPLLRVLNGGCRIEINDALRIGEPLRVRARLESIGDDGWRAILHQRIVTGQRGTPDAVVAHVYAIVPTTSRRTAARPGRRKQLPHVPMDASEVGSVHLKQDAGLDFALLTGDFNPVHWVSPYARALGYRGTILHGFASMAVSFEAVERALRSAGRRISIFDVRFVRPLVLPASVGVFAAGNSVFLGVRGESAVLAGTFEVTPIEQPKQAH